MKLALCLLAALPIAAWCVPCRADAVMAIGPETPPYGASTVTLAPTDRPGALAQVTFNNVAVNNRLDTGTTETLEIPGMVIEVLFEWETDPAGSDRVTITPPDGVHCYPRCEITLTEGSSATIWLFSNEAVGS